MSMIGYTTVGTNDLERAKAFYEAVFAQVDATAIFEDDHAVYFGRAVKDPKFAVSKPFDKKPATVGNGTMIGIRAQAQAQVDAAHAKALALGGQDEGAPGPRGDGGYYGGYFRDLDGNKIVVYVR